MLAALFKLPMDGVAPCQDGCRVCRGGGGGREGSGRGYRREEVSARVTAGSRGHWVTASGL